MRIFTCAAIGLGLLSQGIAVIGPVSADTVDPTREEAVILRCEDGRDPDAGLGGLLVGPDPVMRARAALALGRIGRAESIPLLESLLRDPEPHVRSSAAFALGEIEDSAAAVPLARSIEDRGEVDSHVRALAVEGLGKRAVSRYAGLVVAALDDPSEEVREAACLASWQIRAVGACPRLCALADGPAGELRWKATYALMRMLGTPPAGRTAVAGATDLSGDDRAAIRSILIRRSGGSEEARVRLAAIRGLGRFDDGDAQGAVRAALADPDGRARVEAIRAAAATTPLDTVAPLLEDPDTNVRVTAIEALGRIGDADRAVALLRRNLESPVGREREVAALALATRWHAAIEKGEPPAADRARGELTALAARLLRSEAWTERGIAASVLDGVPDSSLWTGILRDDPRVALQAVEPWVRTLAGAPGGGDSTLSMLRDDIARLLSSSDSVLRAGVFEAISVWAGDSTAAARILTGLGLNIPTTRSDPPARTLPIGDYETILQWARKDRRVEVVTEKGSILLRLFTQDAPLTCWNFVRLADSGFYDRGRWHRIVPDFVVQDGCPRGDGSGGPGYTIRCEINERRFSQGALGMALSGTDTGGSQFFITHSPQPHLDGRYTVFGEVIGGGDVVSRLVQGDRIESVRSVPME